MSAIAAIFSAVIAADALSYLPRQEDVAQKQLQATYRSNLYNKQVDSIWPLQTVILDFSRSAQLDSLTGELTDKNIVADIQVYYNAFKGPKLTSYGSYSARMIRETNILTMVTPKSAYKILTVPAQLMSAIYGSMGDFVGHTPSQETFDKFAREVVPISRQLIDWRQTTFKCFDDLLADGQPITDETVKNCDKKAIGGAKLSELP